MAPSNIRKILHRLSGHLALRCSGFCHIANLRLKTTHTGSKTRTLPISSGDKESEKGELALGVALADAHTYDIAVESARLRLLPDSGIPKA